MAEQKIDFNIPEEVTGGVYSNIAIITHSDQEFVLDFAAMLPGLNKGVVRSRVIMTPQNAKRLLGALNDNIAKYEDQNGTIVDNKRGAINPIIGGNGGLA